MEGKSKYRGLVHDLWPNIKLMQGSGLHLLEYHENDTPSLRTMRKVYSYTTLALLLFGFVSIILYLFTESYDVDDYAANTVTVLYFFHSITRSLWFMLNVKKFYRLFDSWNTTNSHPLFAENDAKHHANSLSRQRRLLIQVMTYTVICVLAWTVITFVSEPVRQIPDPENENMTITVEVPQLMLGAWYPWDAKSGVAYVVSFVYQFYWILLALGQANLYDVLLCSFVIYACGQLRHLKEILRPLMELSATLDSAPNSAGGKKGSGSGGFGSRQNLIAADMLDMDYRGLFKNDNKGQLIDGTNGLDTAVNPGGDGILPPPGVVSTINVGSRGGTATNGVNGMNGMNGMNGTNGTTQLTSKQELLVRSAIKYWVERHKQLVRYVSYISLAFGGELLIHMLNATIVLTILAYQATKVSEFNVYACCTAGYIVYSMIQIYLFCIYGNEIIEESSTVMEAAYSCHWYDGSEEVKTFVQIVCQQCQKNLVVSGARFFTVSLDLFASVLGAMVTYFMVLVQLN